MTRGGAVEVHPSDGDAALVVEHLRHLRLKSPKEDESRQCEVTDERKIHWW